MLEAVSQWLNAALGEQWSFWFDYLTNGKHLTWYASVRYTLFAAALGAALALLFGLLGAALSRSRFRLCRLIGHIYIMMLRGVPDVLFFLFFPLAFEQAFEYLLALKNCGVGDWNQGQWPPCAAAQWYLSTTEYLLLASLSLGLVYGSFAANVIHGALNAVPKGQLEAASAYGFSRQQVFWHVHVRQMWVYALPGLSNVWLLLLKATAFLSLLQIADIVLWAERLGAANYFPRAGLVHPDWRWRYYFVLFVFYILLTLLSEKGFAWLQRKVSRGMPLAGQEN